MQDLWSPSREKARASVEPLAVRMRPRTLEEFAGQSHLLRPSGAGVIPLLRRMIEARTMTSILLHGPPGTGKTTLARLIALSTGRTFIRENAANVSVKRIREIIDEASRKIESSADRPGSNRSILFLDEIHRFTRSQQDVLLDDVERGMITLIGATTENPMFAVNSALVSRSTVFQLEPLTPDDVVEVLRRAIADPERGYGRADLRVSDEALRHWATVCDGDARRALNALEIAVLSEPPSSGQEIGAQPRPIVIDLRTAEQSIQQKMVVYDQTGDEHYDTISAFIKSIRGSDPDAAVYWLALMLEAGEDPRFIARRLAILASEDVGNADPRAIMVAEAAWSLSERLGMPECRLTLSQATTYIALAPKSNASCQAIDEAQADVRSGRTVPVPMYLRDPNKVKSAGSPVEGAGYQYSHNSERQTSIGCVTEQSYLGVEKSYYRPKSIGAEKLLAERLAEVKKARATRQDQQANTADD